jgi:hypothetical protein
MSQMLMQQREVAASVAGGILDLAANLTDRFALPCHLDRRHHPARMSGNAAIRCPLHEGEVALGMTRHAGSLSCHQRLVRMFVVALQGAVAGRMTVHAARMREHLGRLCENGP